MSTPTNGHNKSLNTITAEAAILIIDDNSAIREVLSDIFSSFHADIMVYTAANGHEGVQIIQQLKMRIVLVLLDMNMPMMNGEQTYEKLQQIAPQARVIVSSSLSQDEARLRFGARELPTYLQKPYDINILFNTVQTELAMG